VTRPPLPSPLRFLPFARRPLVIERHEQRYTAACPHGVDVEWTAIRDDSRSHAVCPCTCLEEAAASLYGPQGAGVVIPLPAEESS
jgi:hypothetical protein